jgi:hypothetical protein
LEVAEVEDCLEEEEVEAKRKKMEVRMEIQQKGMGTMKEEELGRKMEMAPHYWKEEEEEVVEMVEKMVRWGCLLD